jgi:hypothetical protein
MYTEELVQATMQERGRQFAQIEREARAEQALRRSTSPRGVPSQERRRSIPLLSFLSRLHRTAPAS